MRSRELVLGILVALITGTVLISGCIKQEPKTGIEWFQTGNTLAITQLETKLSAELEDNRIGQMASLEADVHSEEDADGFVYQNNDELALKWTLSARAF